MPSVEERMNEFCQEPKPQWTVERLRKVEGFNTLTETIITNAQVREARINSMEFKRES